MNETTYPTPAARVASLVRSPNDRRQSMTLAELEVVDYSRDDRFGVYQTLSSGERTLVDIASALLFKSSRSMPSLDAVMGLDAPTRKLVAEILVDVIVGNEK